MRPVVFSASSVNTYLDCHLKWFFAYIALEESESTEAQSVGIEVHDLAAAWLRQDDKETWPVADSVAMDLVEVFHRDIWPTYDDPVLVEAEFQIEIDDIPFSGVIDSIDRKADDSIMLRDLKTTASRPRAGRYRLAMTGYWLGAEALGHKPTAAQLDYIVRTKVPYYWPEVMDPISDYDIAFLSGVLHGAAGGIKAGDYAPTGLGTHVCGNCGYRPICGPYQRYIELTDPKENA